MRRYMPMFLLGVLLLCTTEVDAGRIYRNFGQVKTVSSTEKFFADTLWEEAEELAWTTLTHLGSSGWERRLMMTTLYNETRGRWNKVGDGGCAFGGFQVHVGATVTRRKGWKRPTTKTNKKTWHKKLSQRTYKCRIDNRVYLDEEFKRLHPGTFMEPSMNVRVALATMRGKGSLRNPFSALARYAGTGPSNKKAKRIWGRHKHWWVTGLKKRILKREKEERWRKRSVVTYAVPIVDTQTLP